MVVAPWGWRVFGSAAGRAGYEIAGKAEEGQGADANVHDENPAPKRSDEFLAL